MTDTAAHGRMVKHPAKFTASIIESIGTMLEVAYPEVRTVLDPFAGVGGIHLLHAAWKLNTVGVELEPEWANQHPRNIVGNALHLDGYERWDAVITSPCYGNRMADTAGAASEERRAERTEHTYRHYLGRDLSDDSSAAMQWGEQYRDFHRRVWSECIRVVRPGGLIVVNCKNHYRLDDLQHVNEFHLNDLLVKGCVLERVVPITTPGQRQGSNGDKRVPFELIMVVRTPDRAQAAML